MFLPFLAKAPVLVNGQYVAYTPEEIIPNQQVQLMLLLLAGVFLIGLAVVVFVLFCKAKNKKLILGTGLAWLLLEAVIVYITIRGGLPMY
ncbi:MAG: hypothetical protein LBS41_06680 [Streptococcaceae bacterium]|jgi:hypothetical protein|nr:hypothetical protein [Streptococcaceae bacterium]